MGENNQVLETPAEEASAYIFKDITRVNVAGNNMSWKRINVNELDEWREKFIQNNSKHCYATVQSFANSAVTEGEPYISPLYFDLDSEDDLQLALDDARKLKDYLYTGLDTEYGVEFFFSGNRGFHVTMSAYLFGCRPSSDLSRTLRWMAESMADNLALRTFDRTVYSKRRMWRMNNTQHGKTGLWKIQLTPAEIGGLSVDAIKDLATAPRELEVDV